MSLMNGSGGLSVFVFLPPFFSSSTGIHGPHIYSIYRAFSGLYGDSDTATFMHDQPAIEKYIFMDEWMTGCQVINMLYKAVGFVYTIGAYAPLSSSNRNHPIGLPYNSASKVVVMLFHLAYYKMLSYLHRSLYDALTHPSSCTSSGHFNRLALHKPPFTPSHLKSLSPSQSSLSPRALKF